MPGDLGRSRLLRASCAVLLAILLATAVAAQQPPANPIDRWNRMSPEERERELAKLPPGRARQIRQRIARYNQMRPEEQKALRDRYDTFSHLPPDKQQIVRDRLREFRRLPQARQPVVHREVVRLRSLPEAQRQASMNGDEFHSQFSPQEQQIIRDLTAYMAN
ncbi:MAG: DUF3106 domain-containing protein [Bryobacteraceae bacterium]|jgi:hypothetical protein